MEIKIFTFKGDANDPAKGWYKGFSDAIKYYEDQLIHRRILKFSEIPEYTNGWAEGNITAYSRLNDKLKNTLKNRDN